MLYYKYRANWKRVLFFNENSHETSLAIGGLHGKFIFFFSSVNHLYPLQDENCDSNSRLVVDEDDNRKFTLERVKTTVGTHMILAGN